VHIFFGMGFWGFQTDALGSDVVGHVLLGERDLVFEEMILHLFREFLLLGFTVRIGIPFGI
jgi:hypothetical protein